MKDRVLLQANKLREVIAAEVEGKHICLKVDIASRNERGFLGINIQYVQEGCLRLRTLAVKEMFERHTGNEIKRCILDVLESFRVNIIQVYSTTTDNASNMVKCGQLMHEVEESLDHEFEGDRDEHDFLCETTLEAILVNATNQLDLNIFSINRCAAHTLALAIEDALKRDEDSKKTLSLARRVVKKLRNPNLILKLRERGALKPILDVPTRCGSTYDMMERLLVLKPIILDFGTFNEYIELLEEEWLAIEDLKKSMEAPRNATIRIQDRLLTAGALLAEWEIMELVCQRNLGSYFSFRLEKALRARKHSVIGNVAFIGAVYVDLRYNRLLSPEQKEISKKHLYSVWRRIFLQQMIDSPQATDCSPQTGNMDPDFDAGSPHSDDPLEALLIQKESEHPSDCQVNSTPEIMVKEIEGLANSPRLPKAENIIKYWANHPNQELRKLCLVVLALPVTQVSVERMFSGLKYILNDLRMRMTPEIVDAIMVLRCNV